MNPIQQNCKDQELATKIHTDAVQVVVKFLSANHETTVKEALLVVFPEFKSDLNNLIDNAYRMKAHMDFFNKYPELKP